MNQALENNMQHENRTSDYENLTFVTRLPRGCCDITFRISFHLLYILFSMLMATSTIIFNYVYFFIDYILLCPQLVQPSARTIRHFNKDLLLLHATMSTLALPNCLTFPLHFNAQLGRGEDEEAAAQWELER